MPANLPIEYFKLEDEYSAAKSKQEKIRILEEMLSVIPKHKGAKGVIGDVNRKISLFKKEIELEARKKKGGKRRGIKKEGAAQLALIGPTNTGKSYILNQLCNKKLKSTPLKFETKRAEVGMLNYKEVLIQLIEIPSIYPGFYEKKGEFRGLIYTADALCFVVKTKEDIKMIKSEIEMRGRPHIIIKSTDENIPEKIWDILGLIKVYTKTPGKKPEKRPVALKKGSTVKEVGTEIHNDFIEKFKYAKVIRNKSRIKERQVGLKFILEDEDIIEFHTR